MNCSYPPIMSGGTFRFATLVLILVCIASTCNAKKSKNCNITSSCGHIQNIRFPFRLKTDPESCGDPSYELACENNQTILYFNSMGYYVQSITYQDYRIRIVDPGIRKNQCPPFRLHSLSPDDIPRAYTVPVLDIDSSLMWLNTAVIFVSCPSEIKSSRYVDIATCNTKNTSFNTSSSSLEAYSYVLVEPNLREGSRAEVEDSCTISTVAWFSKEFRVINQTSFLSILDTMANGFLFQWYSVYCGKCEPNNCYLDKNNNVTCQGQRTLFTFFEQIYRGLWSIWKALPDIFWGGLSKEKLAYGVHNYDNPRLRDIPLIIILVVSNLTVLALIVRFLCGLLCLFILIVYKYRRRHLSNDETIEDFLQGQINLMPIRYDYADIRKMTNNFKDKLGEGGYGSVFKGKLRSSLFVAVKVMKKSKASGQEFINEVATIGTIHHVNVVQLIGFCVEGSKRALVYEFMPNGSLEKYIFSQDEKTISLSYEKMFEISLGVARGIDYLHRGCQMQILHFDIKPHNILLDDNFNPKISDFGLAKLYSTEDSIVSLTAARGTMGYMAPELFYKNIGGVSYKADVYSYGMLLMEMSGRRKNLNPFVANLSQIYFPSWVYDQFSEGKEIEMGYSSGEERKMVKKMILVGLWCIQMKPVDRPSMNKIVEMLEGDDLLLQMPPKPFLYPEESDHAENMNDNELSLTSDDVIDSTSLT